MTTTQSDLRSARVNVLENNMIVASYTVQHIAVSKGYNLVDDWNDLERAALEIYEESKNDKH
jgi:hypothetical protein